MQKQRTSITSSTSARCLLVILLVACLVECGTGSCLSYGHSCWGAHGKRSGTAPSSAPDWYLTRMLRRMVALNELNRPRQLPNDESDIYRVEVEPELLAGRLVNDEESSSPVIRNSVDARPMLEDSDIPKMNIWQIMVPNNRNQQLRMNK